MQKFKVNFWKYLPRKIFKDIKTKYNCNFNDYINVYICDNREEMYDLCDKLEKEKLERDYGARTFCYTRNFYDIETGEYVKTSPLCGHIVFNKEYFWMDAITHESTHAVIGYFSRKLKGHQRIFTKVDERGNILSECDIDEELFCYMVGNIADQIVSKSE